jgi:hypothetical protein
MKTNNIFRTFAVLVFATHIVLPLKSSEISAVAEFERVGMPYGISIEIPKHWMIISQANRANLEAAGNSIAKNAGVDLNQNKQNLLAVNSTPAPTGAMIRVSVSAPEYTQADLAQLTSEDLKEAAPIFAEGLKQMEKAGGPKILKIYPVTVEKFGGLHAIVMTYERESIDSNSTWNVTQYKIPKNDILVELTLSRRQSDSIIWSPILDRVKASLELAAN